MIEIGLSLGSNLGRRLANLKRARCTIAATPGIRVLVSSPAYETEPVDVPPEFRRRRFLNAVVIVASAVPVRGLGARLRAIEEAMGRVRTRQRNAPRVIDIDVIYAGRRRVRAPHLVVPHPHWASRRFVLQPLADVRPDLVIPGASRSVRRVLASLPPAPCATLLRATW